jgi:hypothetical protein
MKQIIFYYLTILAPIPLLVWLVDFDKGLFMVFLLIYAIIYRPLTDGYRLLTKGVINRKKLWIMFTGYGNIKYFKELYLQF